MNDSPQKPQGSAPWPERVWLQPNEAQYYSGEGSHKWGDAIAYVPEHLLAKARAAAFEEAANKIADLFPKPWTDQKIYDEIMSIAKAAREPSPEAGEEKV